MSLLRKKFGNSLRPKNDYTSEVERETRAQRKLQDRRNSRAIGFNRNRNIGILKENIELQLTQNNLVKDPQRLKLERWKEERRRQKLEMAKKKQPAFVCGIVRHNVGSPYKSNVLNNTCLKVEKNISGKTTIKSRENQRANGRVRATKKQESVQMTGPMISIPANFKFKAPKGVRPLTIPAQPLKPSNSSIASATKEQPEAKVFQRVTRSMANAAHISGQLNLQNAQYKTENVSSSADAVEATTLVNKSVPLEQENSECAAEAKDVECKSIETITSLPETPKDEAEYLPIHYSPFVNMERRGFRKSVNSTQPDSYITPKKQRTLSTESEHESQEERDGVLYFRNVLQKEVERLEQTNEKWLALRDNTPDLPAEICDLIDVAVGKARLLIKSKLHQFGTLINQCEAGSVPGMPGLKVKCSDLEGFWAMVYIQVEDVDTKFKMLEDAKSRNWQKDDGPSAQIPARKERIKNVRKGKRGVATSSLRSMIAAARRKNQNAVSELASDTSEFITQPRRFSSPIIVNRSSARKSVLQQVLTTEAYKQGLTENPICSMLDVAGMGKDLCSSILLRNDGISDLEDHGVMNNKRSISANEQTPKLANSRQSYLNTSSRKVRFAEEGNHEGKPVQPITPPTSARGLDRRRSSRMSSDDREKFQKSTPEIRFSSPAQRPPSVLRRSRRLNDL